MNKTEYFFDQAGCLKSARYDDVYFSTSGAEEEAEHVFITGSKLPERFSKCETFTIAEAGFGTGLNFMQTLKLWENHFTPSRRLAYFAFEATPLPAALLEKVYAQWSEKLRGVSDRFLQLYPQPGNNHIRIFFSEINTELTIFTGDINITVSLLNQPVNAWYLDGFSPSKNPQMWSPAVFKGIKANSRHGTTAVTYSCARIVREGLLHNNFNIRKIPGFGKKKHMLYAEYSTDNLNPAH